MTTPQTLYKEMIDGKVVDAKRHEQGYIIYSNVQEATPQEIEQAKEQFEAKGHCDVHLMYDEPGWMYNQRYCGICGTFIGLI